MIFGKILGNIIPIIILKQFEPIDKSSMKIDVKLYFCDAVTLEKPCLQWCCGESVINRIRDKVTLCYMVFHPAHRNRWKKNVYIKLYIMENRLDSVGYLHVRIFGECALQMLDKSIQHKRSSGVHVRARVVYIYLHRSRDTRSE